MMPDVRILKSRDDYRRAIERIDELRGHGSTAEENAELAELEGAVARYVAKPGQPASRKGRPGGNGSDVP
jgi:hypothetical protein